MDKLKGTLTEMGSLKGTLSGTGSLRGTLSGGGVGHGIPSGGEPGQGLIKVSDADYDVKWMDILPEDTASGAVASFPDGSDDLPMGVVVDIDPVQDLHGFDNPWPGGGGKNLFDKTKVANVAERVSVEQIDNGFKITNLSAGTYRSTSFYADFAGHDGATVYLKGNVSNSGSNNGYFSVRFYDDTSEVSTAATRVELYSTRTSHTGTVPAGTTRVAFVIYGTGSSSAAVGDTSTFTNVILSLSDVSYAPYSNICPISGWDGAKVTRTGVNVWDEEYVTTGYFEADGTWRSANYLSSKNPIPVKPNTRYYLYMETGAAFVTFWSKEVPSGASAAQYIISRVRAENRVITTPSNCVAMHFNTTDYGTAYNNNISVNYPSTAHSYEPYTGVTHEIPFSTEVYGGKLNVETGELVVDRAMVDMGTLNWAYNTTFAFFASGSLANRAPGYTNIQSDLFKTTPGSWSGTPLQNAIWGNSWNASIYVQIPPYDNDADFVQLVTGHQLVYELATPITLTLDPVEIRSLFGDNNVFADTGNTTVTYLADVKKYIDKKISAAVAAMS